MSSLRGKIHHRVLELRQKGLSLNQIAKEIGCVKSAVMYHCVKGYKQRAISRIDGKRKIAHPYWRKLETFQREKAHFRTYKNPKIAIRKCISRKKQNFLSRGKQMNTKFTVEDVINKFGDSPRCYLSGELLNLTKPRSFNFDHIIPVSRGGNNSLENLGLCTKKANEMKGDMTPDELINMCKKILEHQGYQISKSTEQDALQQKCSEEVLG